MTLARLAMALSVAATLTQAPAIASEHGVDRAHLLRGSKDSPDDHALVRYSRIARRSEEVGVARSHGQVPRGLSPSDHPIPASADLMLAPQLTQGAALAPSPVANPNFPALDDNGTRIPPDTNGAVGPDHLMTALNSEVRIQGRSGAQTSCGDCRVSLAAFWGSFGKVDVFDPRVTYDPLGDRWVFVSVANRRSAASALLIAVSRDSDPTGLWDIWKADADDADLAWADYPSLGVNGSWVVVQVNMYPNAGEVFSHGKLFAFSKPGLYSGGSAPYTWWTHPYLATAAPASSTDPANLSMQLVETWNSASGMLALSTISGTADDPLLSFAHRFVSAPEPWSNEFGANLGPQLGSTGRIDLNDDRMLGCTSRNGSTWCVHTIFLPAVAPTRTAIQWWELGSDGSVRQRGRIEDPSGGNFYAFPSIAVNMNNDALIGYSRFSAGQYASANYSFRAGSDPLNMLREDMVLKAGEAPYVEEDTKGRNRWGDYSGTVVDPLNDVDMWTIQEYAASPSNRWGTWWGRIVPPALTPATGPFQPDALIARPGDELYSGDGVFNGSGGGQSKLVTVAPRKVATFFLAAQNDAAETDTLRVQGGGSRPGFSVQYFMGSVNVTASVVNGSAVFDDIPSGELGEVLLKVRVARNARKGAIATFLFTSSSAGDPLRMDTVAAVVKVR